MKENLGVYFRGNGMCDVGGGGECDNGGAVGVAGRCERTDRNEDGGDGEG